MPPTLIVVRFLKQASSWSCFHGVGRWKEDCGCSTGGHPGWNQKWRKPLREALNYLRDELIVIYEKEAPKYLKNINDARDNYIDVILDRSEMSINSFLSKYFVENLSEEDVVKGMELLEIQRQSMLMYTSCGWFFSEISGIETTQIMKYAARAIQLAIDFSKKNLEEKFLEILSEAKSNFQEFGNGKNIYENFVKPSIVTTKQIACLWAISSLYEDFEDEENVYCYNVSKKSYKKVQKGSAQFIIGNIEITSKITLQKSNLIFALMQYSGGDFHCTIKEFSTQEEFENLQKDLFKTFLLNPLTEIIRKLDKNFGSEYFTLKDIFIEERKKILQLLLKGKMKKFSQIYQDMYNEGKSSIYQMQNLGLSVPNEFKISAQYALSRQFNDLITNSNSFIDTNTLQQAVDINFEAKKLDVKIDKKESNKIFSKKVLQNIIRLSKSFEKSQAEATFELFDLIEKLDLNVDIKEAQNIYYTKIYHSIGDIIDDISSKSTSGEKNLAIMLLDIGKKLNINTEFYRQMMDKKLLS